MPSAAADKGPGQRRIFDVHDHGALGDGRTLDSAAIQAAIDAAAAVGGQVLLRGGHRYLVGTLTLRGGIDFHMAKGAELVASTRPEDYAGDVSAPGAPGADTPGALLRALAADDLTISGAGAIDGRSPEFMERYDAENEWWIPRPFRPRLLVLENCARLTIRDLTLRRAPSWTVHLLGCRQVLIERLTILNQLDVPNCDGIDPDHCQDVEIRGCHIVCGDDAIVIKATAGHQAYGASRNIRVHDCRLETQDAGLKIGTETHQDVHDIVFERCQIVRSCRGLCIQVRDAGSVHGVVFRHITFDARHHSAPWWGRGEAISFTAIPRNAATRVGTIRDVLVEDVSGHAENSLRIEGLGGGRVSDIVLRRVDVTLGRRTHYPGGVFDNRPTTVVEALEAHDTPGVSLRHADRITFEACRVRWDREPPAEFSNLLQTQDVTGLDDRGLTGEAAHPHRDPPRLIR
ncbi:MAG: right-handed parallel beta-helix repeat-containing protein [Caulobacterales bacterium]|nr:right-handed parallel beta-helix repeat-containing protein [Caulobacterales bacterium]